jgi:TolB-like protein
MSARPSAIALLFATAVLVPVPLARSVAPAIRVAVSDFQPGGATPEDQRSLGAGLQSMLTTDLAASSHITVVERARLADVRKELKLGHSAAADPATAAKLGRLAGASHLVTGTFTLVGNTLRLDARVIDVGTGRVALATDASGDKDTFFELEKKIAGAIISELGVTLTPKERASFARVQTADWQALRRFGDGLRLFEDADYDRALQALRDATERDREFKLAATTLESYERLVREIRSRAAVIEAEQDAKISLRGHDLREQEQAVVDALSAVAARKEPGRPARLRRSVALYFVVKILDDRNVEGVDRFARDRLLDAFVTRYVHEADGLFPDLPMVPFQPMGEIFGSPRAPEKPADIDKAIDATVDRFAHYGTRGDADELRKYKEGHIQGVFAGHGEQAAHCMHLDARRTAELLDHFYDESVRFSPNGRWRADALVARARHRRTLLEIDESTRLFHAASQVETDPGSLRKIASQIDNNGKISSVLASRRSAPCLREWAGYLVASSGDWAGDHMMRESSTSDLCALDAVRFGRTRVPEQALFREGTSAWTFQPHVIRPLSAGPRADTDRLEELRYKAADGDRNPWALIILEGVPRRTAALSFDLNFEPAPDLVERCRAKSGCPSSGRRPTVAAVFEATDLLIRARRRRNEPLDDVPMRATVVAIGPDTAEKANGEVLLASERMGTEGPKPASGERQAFAVPTTTKVTVRREERRIVIEAGGRRASFDAAPAHAGFVGLMIQGPGIARISSPRVQPLP